MKKFFLLNLLAPVSLLSFIGGFALCLFAMSDKGSTKSNAQVEASVDESKYITTFPDDILIEETRFEIPTLPDEGTDDDTTGEDDIPPPPSTDDVNDGNQDGSDGDQDNTDGDQDNSDGDQDNTDGDQDNTDGDQDNTDGDQDNTDGDQDNTDGDQDNTDGDQDNTDGDQDNSDGDQDNSDGDQDNTDGDQDNSDEEQLTLNVEEIYKNSQADGKGTMLWTLNVNYGGSNASKLLEEKGYYLSFKLSYGKKESDWFAFSYAFYLDEEEGYNNIGYLNHSVYSVQFAVINTAPNDVTLGGYNPSLLTEENFIAISEIYYNANYEAEVSDEVQVTLNVEESYKNSQADGNGKMLWNIHVNSDGLNASDLLAEKGYYLCFKFNYGEEESEWYAFSYASYLEEVKDGNIVYMNQYVYSVQFAVINIAPIDEDLGKYDSSLLTEENFIEISDNYYNEYYAA